MLWLILWVNLTARGMQRPGRTRFPGASLKMSSYRPAGMKGISLRMNLSRKKVTSLASYKGNLHVRATYMQRRKSAKKPKIPLYVIGEGKLTELKTSAPFFWCDYGERKAESFLSRCLEEQITISYGMEPLAKCHEDIMALGQEWWPSIPWNPKYDSKLVIPSAIHGPSSSS